MSFRREKHVVLGGPDGGDGGKGGDVVVICDNNAHTLAKFKGKKELRAQNGQNGDKRNRSGKSGANLELFVPPGTQIIDESSGKILLDITQQGQREILLRGGKGGLGNTHFKNASNQRPDYAQPGIQGESIKVRLELKLIADVGLVGFPNVGKSSLISTLSNARVQIADYEFTTLTPKLGLVNVGEYESFVMADIPGIIEQASGGKGLGLTFLRHIERCKFLLFILDTQRAMSLKEQFEILRAELENFNLMLFQKPFGITLSKCDMMLDEANLKSLQNYLKEQNIGSFICEISALNKKGLDELKFTLLKSLKES